MAKYRVDSFGGRRGFSKCEFDSYSDGWAYGVDMVDLGEADISFILSDPVDGLYTYIDVVAYDPEKMEV